MANVGLDPSQGMSVPPEPGHSVSQLPGRSPRLGDKSAWQLPRVKQASRTTKNHKRQGATPDSSDAIREQKNFEGGNLASRHATRSTAWRIGARAYVVTMLYTSPVTNWNLPPPLQKKCNFCRPCNLLRNSHARPYRAACEEGKFTSTLRG